MIEPEAEHFLDEAFVAEISEAQVALNAYILKLVGHYHHAKDILQETNMILWKKRMDWDPQTPFLKWAYRVAYFQTKGHFRDQKKQKDRFFFSPDLLELLSADTPKDEGGEELRAALESCLKTLDQDKREALMERYQGEHSVEAIANRRGQSPNTFSQMLRRLRGQLSKCIEQKLQPSP